MVCYSNNSVPGKASLVVYQYLMHSLLPGTKTTFHETVEDRIRTSKNNFMTKDEDVYTNSAKG